MCLCVIGNVYAVLWMCARTRLHAKHGSKKWQQAQNPHTSENVHHYATYFIAWFYLYSRRISLIHVSVNMKSYQFMVAINTTRCVQPGIKRKRRRRGKKLSNLLFELPLFCSSYATVIFIGCDLSEKYHKMFSIINRHKVWKHRTEKYGKVSIEKGVKNISEQ